MNYLDQIEAEDIERITKTAALLQAAQTIKAESAIREANRAEKRDIIAEVKARNAIDEETDQRYEVHVASEQGKSRIYIMATSVSEVKRAMKHKPGYVTLMIVPMVGSMSANVPDPEVEGESATIDPASWQRLGSPSGEQMST